MSFMMELLNKLYPLRLAPVSDDTDRAAAILKEVLPFKVCEYESGKEHNGWTVPMKWRAVSAKLLKGGRVIYDGMEHPLGVIGYSTSFNGRVSLAKLKQHLFFHPVLKDSRVYHCDYFYKQWKKDWGFSVTRDFFDGLTEGEYEVALKTEFMPGTMKVLDFELKGATADTIIINAHNCHAGQANDDIAGVVVGIEVMRRLMQLKKRKYTYRLIVAPEHLGTVFYLNGLSDEEAGTFKYAVFLEMLGTDKKFALQESFLGQSLLDKACHNYLKHNFPEYHSDKFRKIVGNDETVWESPGYEIPCVSLSRMLYPEYHSDKDNADIISEVKLEESVNTVMGIFTILESDTAVNRNFKGLLALSNPKYDLYISTADPSIRIEVTGEQKKWNYLMDCIIRYFDGKTTLLDIAIKHDIEHAKLVRYVEKFRQKQLVSFVE